MKYLLAIMILFNICLYGCRDKAIVPNTNENPEEEIEDTIKQINSTFYVAPYDGLDLWTEPSLDGVRIRELQQYTKLEAYAVTSVKETVDGITDYWYGVNADGESGWVFGGYLIRSINNNEVMLEKPIILEDRYCEFSNGQRINFGQQCESRNYKIDYLRVYEKTSRTSSYFEIHDKEIVFYKLDGTEDWLYVFLFNSIGTGEYLHGFVYVYEISEESFYGSSEDMKKPWYSETLKKEYDIINKHKNIKRFGPVVMVYYDYNVFKFWDKFYGYFGKRDIIVGYLPEHDEVSIETQYIESNYYSIFNLKNNMYSVKDIGYPFFSPSKNYIIALGELYDEVNGLDRILGIYLQDGLVYKKIFEHETAFYKIKNVVWQNNEAEIEFEEADSLHITINTVGDKIVIQTDNPLPKKYIRIDAMTGYRIFRFNEIELKEYEGAYKIDAILNGEINIKSFEFDSLSEIDIQMTFNEDTGELYVLSNFPHESEMTIYGRNRTLSTIYSGGGPIGEYVLNMYFTNRGIILDWTHHKWGEYYYECTLLLKRIE